MLFLCCILPPSTNTHTHTHTIQPPYRIKLQFIHAPVYGAKVWTKESYDFKMGYVRRRHPRTTETQIYFLSNPDLLCFLLAKKQLLRVWRDCLTTYHFIYYSDSLAPFQQSPLGETTFQLILRFIISCFYYSLCVCMYGFWYWIRFFFVSHIPLSQKNFKFVDIGLILS